MERWLATGKDWMIANCGLNCAKCDIYEAAHGYEEKRKEILAWFKEKRNKILKPEQINCEGCNGPLNAHWSGDCKIMLCAREKGAQYCFQCEGFPCSILKAFSLDGNSSHRKTVENLEARANAVVMLVSPFTSHKTTLARYTLHLLS